jgi:hypothetical protein
MSGRVNPIDNPAAWDTVVIAGQSWPGLAKIEGDPSLPYTWDVKEGRGADGATTTLTGTASTEFAVVFYLWTRAHFVAWDLFRTLLKYNTSALGGLIPSPLALRAFDFYHPSLADIDVMRVCTKRIGAIQYEGDGMWTAKVELLKYGPPPKRPAIATPAGTLLDSPGGQPDPKVVAKQSELAKALAAMKAAGG